MTYNKDYSKIQYLIVDVDGTLTDAGVYYDDNGNELKKFCTKDAAGFFAAHSAGIKIMILTGRECAATTRRMNEMKVDYLIQKCKDKATFLQTFMQENGIMRENLGYVGDDLNDLAPMKLCGFVGCPEDACIEVKNISDYIGRVKGGYGAFRDVVEYLLTERGEWDTVVEQIYGVGI